MNDHDKPNPTSPADSGGLAGSKLTTVFAIVLAAHVLIIIAALSWYFLSGRSGDTALDQAAAPASTPALASPGEAQLETDPAPLISSEVIETMNETVMPGSTDPVWGAAPAPLPNADPFADPVAEAPTGQTVAPLPPLAPLTSTAPAPVAVPAETAAALGRAGAPTPPKLQPLPSASTTAGTAPASAKPTGTTTYRVVQGDTLSRIARRHGTTVAEIQRLNGLTTDALRIGQILKVTGPTPARTSKPSREWTASHTVAPGETLYRISRTYNVTPTELAKVNNIADPTRLRVGTVLRVPGSGTAQAAPAPAKPAPAREARRTPTLETAPAVSNPGPATPRSTPVREAKAGPELKPFRPPVLTKEMVMMNM